MDNYFFWFVVLLGMITIYRMLSRRLVTPKSRVAGMLRRYRSFERAGLSEQECLFKLLSTRRGWTNLPETFLREVVSRLSSKEDVMRFVSLSEGYRFDQTHFPGIAGKHDVNGAMTEIACLLANFGNRLQQEGRLKEAEFVQKLALKLQPKEYFTNLPLAVTYYKMERYAEAVSLFKDGLGQFEKFEIAAKSGERASSLVNCLGSNASMKELKVSYRDMYQSCLEAARSEKQRS
ncbi:MAG: hypothetical protein ACREQ7_21725 [Candidatus Binatia bacterium]